MKLAGWLLLVFGLVVACGDNKPVAEDATVIRDASADAPFDAFMGCEASDQCLLSTPICCVVVHAGGEVGRGFEVANAGPVSCPNVSCRGTGDPCLTLGGTSGTCTSETAHPSNIQYWVCQ